MQGLAEVSFLRSMAVRRKSATINEPEKPSIATAICEWLMGVAIEDDRNIGNRLMRLEVEGKPFLGAAEPYILFDFHLLNTTVFPLTCTRIEGRIEYGGQPLLHDPQLVEANQVLPHAVSRHVLIRQYLLPDTARLIRDHPDGILLGRMALWFSYDYFGEAKTLRQGGPNAFTKVGF
jgi:hypothetical protein